MFVGIDVSKETLDVSVVVPGVDGSHDEVIGYDRFDNRPCGFRRLVGFVDKLARRLKTGPDECLYCCETTGRYDRPLCLYIHGRGLDIWREAALQIKLSIGFRRGKNDRADSKDIALYALKNACDAEPFIPCDTALARLAELLSYRKQLVDRRTSQKNRLASLKGTLSGGMTSEFIVSDIRREITALDRRIGECEDLMRSVVESDDQLKENYRYITSMNGLGLINAVALIVSTDNFDKAYTSRSLACYCGLVTFYANSGTSVHKPDGTKHVCNKTLKTYITSAALCAIRHNKTIATYYRRLIEKGKPDGVAKNNVKCKLLNIVFSLVRNKTYFEDRHEEARKENIRFSA